MMVYIMDDGAEYNICCIYIYIYIDNEQFTNRNKCVYTIIIQIICTT